MNGSGLGSIKRDFDALVDCCFDLGKNRGLFCEWVASLESCDMMNSSCKDFFFWLFDCSVECWAKVLCTDMVCMLWV